MAILPIESDVDLERALARIDALWPNKDKSKAAGNELKVLAVLIEDYEAKHYPMPALNPVDAIRFRMEQLGKKPIDLTPIFGSRGRVSEVLSGKRPLTLDMIRKVHASLGIPAEVLLAEPKQRIVRAKSTEGRTQGTTRSKLTQGKTIAAPPRSAHR